MPPELTGGVDCRGCRVREPTFKGAGRLTLYGGMAPPGWSNILGWQAAPINDTKAWRRTLCLSSTYSVGCMRRAC